jgi:predicted TIM-barrel fold metal-dependent hydrolase
MEPLAPESALAVPTELLDVLTGEVLPATPENAARVLEAAREMKRRMDDVVAAATAYVAEESLRQGTKTLAAGGAKIELSGGPQETFESVEEELAEALREAGVPEERVGQAVYVEEVRRLKVDRGVLRQLASANPAYAEAIRSVRRTVERPLRVSVKRS